MAPCEGVLEESVPSPEGKKAADMTEGEQCVAESKEGENAGMRVRAREGGKFEVSLVEEGANVIGQEQELSFWEEDIRESGERRYKVELELWKRKQELEKLREYERVKTQELLRDFPHLCVWGAVT